MAAAAGERLSFDSVLAATLQDLKLSFSLRNEQRTALKSFLERKMYSEFFRPDTVKV